MSGSRLLIAEIATAHGVKGLVKLRYFGENPDDLKRYNPLYTSKTGHDTLTLHIKNPIKGGFVAEVEGITDRNQAELLRKQKLFIEEDAIAVPDDGEFLYKDLIDCDVFDNNQKIGKVIAVENFGAGDLLEIRPPIGQPFYLPFKDEFVPEVDITSQKITVIIPEGLV